ncbi:MAG: HAMP domain-containing histidine kinase [Acidobacteriota bacterium]|nr:HAMP domain-containing histidine kinase [Acidobacteriota bacterium]
MRSRSLRLRLILIFGLGTLLLSSLLGTLTFFGVRDVLISQQQQTDLQQSYVNAALIRNTIYTAPLTLDNEVNSIEQSANSTLILRIAGQWQTLSPLVPTVDISAAAMRAANQGHVSTETRTILSDLDYVVGIPMPAIQTQVFEVWQLNGLEHNLRVLLLVIGSAALFTTILGASVGTWVSRRTLRPLVVVSDAAARIAGGDFATRLPTTHAGSEVEQLTESFNTMVNQLVTKLERDARFASDVSHELRSPLTALAMSASIIEQHRDELAPAAQQSLSLLSAEIGVFQGLIEDLIELSRSDAGANSPSLEIISIVELTRQAVRSVARRQGAPEPSVEADPRLDTARVLVDRRRFERIIANLMDNAQHYAGGVTAIRLVPRDAHVEINVDDAGPGIAPADLEHVFERFYRGRAAHDRSVVRGTGLGLALVREHVRSLDGEIRATTSPEGGARFQIDLPLVEVPS